MSKSLRTTSVETVTGLPSLTAEDVGEEGTGLHIKHDTIPCPPPDDLIALSVPPANDTMLPANDTAPAKRPRGFAALTPDKRREIASRGGKMAHIAGTAHQWTQEEARIAGRKGGLVSSGNTKKPRA